ncbi:hypothetical protein DDB_G0292278 [Dictyostelium discoideum AX4]|uniref:Uncharacterized protein n=1 Tax=Dictyostelium discoideum TaxID=44689 RepID=Q54DH0_DICDI|nr:hypothetical protein DDB_G0292278 [Dictyostelium discoideum AX4]EAL61263.1 hypothetical protein DDB_G0292278 [Dictyostelium discoideum AX4]|eukprot:XP_629671.1 hypothetical protein DDB_G0292278 [Dictyostelium discoideum AX4]
MKTLEPNEFKKINKLLQKTENDKIKELSTHFNTNKEINTTFQLWQIKI